MKKRFIVEIEVDEDSIWDKYPNFKYNWSNAQEFIEDTIKSFEQSADTDLRKNGLKEWGYSVKVIEEIEETTFDKALREWVNSMDEGQKAEILRQYDEEEE